MLGIRLERRARSKDDSNFVHISLPKTAYKSDKKVDKNKKDNASPIQQLTVAQVSLVVHQSVVSSPYANSTANSSLTTSCVKSRKKCSEQETKNKNLFLSVQR